jgi:hypothetical protein
MATPTTDTPVGSTEDTGPGWSGSSPRRRPQPRRAHRRENVGRTERIASLIAGGILGTIALNRRGRFGLALSVAAGELVYRGVTGHCHVYSLLGITDRGPGGRPRIATGTKKSE